MSETKSQYERRLAMEQASKPLVEALEQVAKHAEEMAKRDRNKRRLDEYRTIVNLARTYAANIAGLF